MTNRYQDLTKFTFGYLQPLEPIKKKYKNKIAEDGLVCLSKIVTNKNQTAAM